MRLLRGASIWPKSSSMKELEPKPACLQVALFCRANRAEQSQLSGVNLRTCAHCEPILTN